MLRNFLLTLCLVCGFGTSALAAGNWQVSSMTGTTTCQNAGTFPSIGATYSTPSDGVTFFNGTNCFGYVYKYFTGGTGSTMRLQWGDEYSDAAGVIFFAYIGNDDECAETAVGSNDGSAVCPNISEPPVECWDGSEAPDFESCPVEPTDPGEGACDPELPYMTQLFCKADLEETGSLILLAGLTIIGIFVTYHAAGLVKRLLRKP